MKSRTKPALRVVPATTTFQITLPMRVMGLRLVASCLCLTPLAPLASQLNGLKC